MPRGYGLHLSVHSKNLERASSDDDHAGRRRSRADTGPVERRRRLHFKPCDPSELHARMLSLLRRASRSKLNRTGEATFGRNSVDFVKWRVLRDGKPIAVSSKEILLLRYLITHSGTIVSREELLREVWDYQTTTTRTVDVHIAGLRQKLEENPRDPQYLRTIRGEGYLFSTLPPNVRKALHHEASFDATASDAARLLLQESSSQTK